MTGSRHPAGRPRLLLVEDQPELREVLRLYLGGCGFEVTTAEDGVAGLAAARTVLPDVMVLDVLMPNLDGAGLMDALRSDAEIPPIPTVVYTGLPDQDARVKALLRHSGVSHVSKGSLTPLRAALGQFLEPSATAPA